MVLGRLPAMLNWTEPPEATVGSALQAIAQIVVFVRPP
jgi:hypothetical protein